MMEKWNLPTGWEWVKLSSLLAELESGRRPKGGVQNIQTGVPSISGEHIITKGGFDFSKLRYIPQDFALSLKQGWIKKGDILIVKDGATTGKIAYIGDDFPFSRATINEHVFRVRGKPDRILQKYLFYFLYSSAGQEILRATFKGAAIGGINRQFVDSIYVPLPYSDNLARSLAEQRRIVARLEALLGEVKAMRQQVEAMQQDINRLMESALAEVFEQDTKIFSNQLLENVTEIHDGGRIPIKESERHHGNIPYCGANGVIDYVDGFTHEGEFVLLAEDGGNFKAFEQSAYMMNGRFWANNHVHILRGSPGVMDSKYLYYVLYYMDLTPYLTGATRPKLTQNSMRKLSIPIPYPDDPERSLAEQRRIVAYLESIQQEVQEAQKLIQSDLRAIEQLQQSILAAAFRGEL